MSERKEISQFYCEFDPFDLNGRTLSECAKLFKDMEKVTTDGKSLRFDIERYGYEGGVIMNINKVRLENDEEYNFRLEYERQEAERKLNRHNKQVEKERAMYEKLKAKFGD